jgi:hypothetical protein
MEEAASADQRPPIVIGLPAQRQENLALCEEAKKIACA